MSELARRYALALYSVCPDEQTLEQTAHVLMDDATLWQILCSPAIQGQEKARVLARLPVLDGHGLLLNFYRLLAEKGRMTLLPEILEAFNEEVLRQKGMARCRLSCVRAPDAAELDKLRRALCRLHHKQDVIFEIRTDPSLLGGFTLEIEGVRYDKSVRGALSGLGRQLEERRMA